MDDQPGREVPTPCIALGRASPLELSVLTIVSGAVGASLTFALVRGLKVEAAAGILVAVATFVLAYFTWQSLKNPFAPNEIVA